VGTIRLAARRLVKLRSTPGSLRIRVGRRSFRSAEWEVILGTLAVSWSVRRRLAAALLLASLFALTAGPTRAHAAQPVTTILRVPLDISYFLPCANGGTGEIVNVSGTFMMLFHTTSDATGGTHIKTIEVQQRVAGVGETTGDRYVSTFVNLFNYNDSSALTSTQQVVFRITGPGPGNDALIRIVNHSTINPDGTITVAFDTITVECEATAP